MDAQRNLDDLVVEADLEHSLDVVGLGVLAERLAEERRKLFALLRAAAQVGALLAHAIAVERVRMVQSRLRAELDAEFLGRLLHRVGHRLELAAHGQPQRVVLGVVLAMTLVGLEVAFEEGVAHRQRAYAGAAATPARGAQQSALAHPRRFRTLAPRCESSCSAPPCCCTAATRSRSWPSRASSSRRTSPSTGCAA